MVTTVSPLFALGIEVIGMTVAGTILFSANTALGTTTQLALPKKVKR
jgi:hypothetical protein